MENGIGTLNNWASTSSRAYRIPPQAKPLASPHLPPVNLGRQYRLATGPAHHIRADFRGRNRFEPILYSEGFDGAGKWIGCSHSLPLLRRYA